MKIYRMGEKIDWKSVSFEPLTPEQEKEAKALIDASFTAEDLQLFTEVGEDIPFEQLLAEMEELLDNSKEIPE